MNQPTILMIGLAAGLCARCVLLRCAPGGLPLALLLGIAGSMFATFLTQQFGLGPERTNVHFFAAVLGAAVLLLGYRLDLSRDADHAISSPDLNLHQ